MDHANYIDRCDIERVVRGILSMRQKFVIRLFAARRFCVEISCVSSEEIEIKIFDLILVTWGLAIPNSVQVHLSFEGTEGWILSGHGWLRRILVERSSKICLFRKIWEIHDRPRNSCHANVRVTTAKFNVNLSSIFF